MIDSSGAFPILQGGLSGGRRAVGCAGKLSTPETTVLSIGLLLTMNMSFHQDRQLIQDQFRDINLPYPLFQCATAVSNDLNDLVHECPVRGDLGVPRIDKVLDDDGDDGIKLHIDVVGTGKRR
jgi:hypothetical protein